MDEPGSGSACRLRGKGQSRREPHGYARQDMLRRVEQSQKSFPTDARGRFTGPIPRCNLLVPRSCSNPLPLYFGVGDHQEAPALHVFPTWRAHSRFHDFSDQVVRNRVRLRPPRWCSVSIAASIRTSRDPSPARRGDLGDLWLSCLAPRVSQTLRLTMSPINHPFGR